MDPTYRFFARFFPELKHLETEAERRKALAKARWHCMGIIGYSLYGLGAAALLFFPVIFINRFLSGVMMLPFGVSTALRIILVAPIAIAVGLGVAYAELWLFRGRLHRELRCQMIESGVPICPVCGYDLRGLAEVRCPEYGKPFELIHRSHAHWEDRPAGDSPDRPAKGRLEE